MKYAASRAWTAIALYGLLAITLGGCDTEDPPVIIEETQLSPITSSASRASGPQITDNVVAYQRVSNFAGGSGGVLDELRNIRLLISESFYSKSFMKLNEDLSSFEGTLKTSVYEGMGTIRWSQPDQDGDLETHSSVTALKMTMEFIVDGSVEELSCYDSNITEDWANVTCATIEGTMYNPFPRRRPEIVITGRSYDPIRDNEDPASFSSEDVVLHTRRPQGLLAYRNPSIYPLSVARDFTSADANGQERWRVRAAIDRGSAATLEVGFNYRPGFPVDEPVFASAGLTPIDPNTGLVEKCVFSHQLGVPQIPPTTFTGPLQYFWTVAFSVSGASDEIQSDLVTVSLGPELQEIQTPTVFSSGCQ